ncbi:hypothetical protein GILI108418_11100 [Gillisia limnaea]
MIFPNLCENDPYEQLFYLLMIVDVNNDYSIPRNLERA